MKWVAQDYRDFTNEKTCVYNRLQVTAKNFNISSPEQKTLHSLKWLKLIVLVVLVSSFIVVSVCAVGGCFGISDWSTDFIQCTSLSVVLSLPSFWHTHTLCESLCLALSLPPTTHSMLYKSYINASSAPFWRWTSQPHLFRKPLYKSKIFTWHFDLFILHNLLNMNQYWQSQGIWIIHFNIQSANRTQRQQECIQQ